jgi:hypothetical protein
MAKWIRPLSGARQWHVPASDRDFYSANALCGEKFTTALETTSDDEKSARDGHCPSCEQVLTTKQQTALASSAR